MSPNRFMNFMALLLLAFNQDCRATTIVIAVASDGVVIASDSKQRSGSSSGLTSNPEPADKVVVLGDRVGVGVVGLANYRVGTTANLVEFHASEFLEGVKHSLASNPSVSLVEDVLIDKLKVAMDRLAPYVANGMIHKQSADEGDLIDFIVAGYDQRGRVAVRKIRVECDWVARKLSSPIVETQYPIQTCHSTPILCSLGERKVSSTFKPLAVPSGRLRPNATHRSLWVSKPFSVEETSPLRKQSQ
jgi:hypothetical protein